MLVNLFSSDRREKGPELLRNGVIYVVVVLVAVQTSEGGRGEGVGQVDLSDGRDECDNFDAIGNLEIPLGNGARSDATYQMLR